MSGESAGADGVRAIVLRSAALELRLDGRTGALVGLRSPATGWEALGRPELGEAFRLLVPTRPVDDWHAPGRRLNRAFGDRQVLDSVTVDADGRGATLTWQHMDTEHAGRLPIGVTQRWTIDDERATLATTIENRSPYPVESVDALVLGDLVRPAGAPWFRTFCQPSYAALEEWSLWPTYDSVGTGYWGTEGPTQLHGWLATAGSPMAPFIQLRGPDEGLVIHAAAADPELVAWQTELFPGWGASMFRRVPEGSVQDGRPVAVRFAAVQLPHVAPGETRALVPVAIAPFRGDWHAGIDRYRAWRDRWLTPASPPAWLREPHSWQQFQPNGPEDDLRLAYRDLVELGRSAAAHGIGAIQLTGWNDGGQDQGNPSHATDPRLGTEAELRAAIAAVRAMGVKVILFAKFTWADIATERYRQELIRHAILDPYGDPYLYPGYGYRTASSLLGVSTRRFAPMCFLDERFLRVAEAEFARVLALDPDGMLYDEGQHHSPALQCFARDHGHRVGAAVAGNDRELIRRFRRTSDAVRPDFLYAGEALYDWEAEVYPLSYLRTADPTHVPYSAYLQPGMRILTAATGFDDREMVNQALLYGYVLMYEPLHFKGRLEDAPATVAYGGRMDALRREVREWVWDAACRHTVGATVTTADGPHHPYSVFRRADGRRAVVVANQDAERTATVTVALDDGSPLRRARLVDEDGWRPVVDGRVVLPPRSAAVILP